MPIEDHGICDCIDFHLIAQRLVVVVVLANG